MKVVVNKTVEEEKAMIIQKGSDLLLTIILFGLALILFYPPSSFAANTESSVIVNVNNFVRAETAIQFDRGLLMTDGKVNTLVHFRQPTPLDKQNVIRMNRDTLYSAAIVDISKGATLTIPEIGDRYLSIMVINEDHYINEVYHGAGTYHLTRAKFDTPYVLVGIRTLVDASDPEDIKAVNAIQDQIVLTSSSATPYTHPNYDKASYETTYKALIELGRGVSSLEKMFGKKEEVGEVLHLVGTAIGWGGLPAYEAEYINVEPNLPVGAYLLTVKDVPVNAFWSISLYNKDGFFQENEYNAYSVNNITGTPNEDGSFTIHFGGDPNSTNFLPIMEGWNYLIRLYQPRKEITERTWVFPSVKPVK